MIPTKEFSSYDALEFHHVGVIVQSMADSILHYEKLFGRDNISSITKIESQKVMVCFVKVGPSAFVELVQPLGEDSVVHKLLKKQTTYYHAGYKVTGISAAVDSLEALGYKAMPFFVSEAFDGKQCVFLFSPEGHLMELIEK